MMDQLLHQWLPLLCLCIPMFFWGSSCVTGCGCFTGCNPCSSGTASATFVLTGMADTGFCSSCANMDATYTGEISVSPCTFQGAVDEDSCLCQTSSDRDFGCGPVGNGARAQFGFLPASGGQAEVQVGICDNISSCPVGVPFPALFSYKFDAPINCGIANGPNAMTLLSSDNTNYCDGTSASATIQLGP
jgi:hypothetical protein